MRTPAPGSGWGRSVGWTGADGSESVAQRFAGLTVAIAIEISVALAQQLLGAGIGADLLAAVATTAWGGAIGDHRSGAAPPELGIQVLLGLTAAEVAPVGKGLAVFHHHEIDVEVADHLRHRAAVAVGGVGLDAHLAAPRQALDQIGAGLLTPRGLGRFRRVDAGQADGDGSRANTGNSSAWHWPPELW
jgi:hypothetical protein